MSTYNLRSKSKAKKEEILLPKDPPPYGFTLNPPEYSSRATTPAPSYVSDPPDYTSRNITPIQEELTKEQILREVYFNPASKASFSGAKKIYKVVQDYKKGGIIDKTIKITNNDIKKFLEEQSTYQIHKREVKKFSRRKTMVSYVDQQWQADLVDMQKYKKDNNDYKYILTVIDLFSRYAWAKPLKSKRGEGVKEAFIVINNKYKVSPTKIQFDDGKEFYNKPFKDLLKSWEIEFFSSKSVKKAAVVERFNRTLKTRMWKYFTQNETFKWIDILPYLVKTYNQSYHSSIGMKPLEARKKENAGKVWEMLYAKDLEKNYGKAKYKQNDYVRISKFKKTFTKGYEAHFTEEIFRIERLVYTHPIVYKLVDLNNEDIDGYFYEQELSHVPNFIPS